MHKAKKSFFWSRMKKLFIPFLLLTLLLSACNAEPTSPPDEQRITRKGDTINATVGSEFNIVVRARKPSTEYHWEMAEAIDTTLVEYVWKDFVPDFPGDPDPTGREFWRFNAVAPGETTITLGLYLGMTDVASQTLVVSIVIE